MGALYVRSPAPSGMNPNGRDRSHRRAIPLVQSLLNGQAKLS
jgi:hypothetical protein